METVTNHGGSGPVTTSAKFFRDEKSRTRIEHGDMVSIDDPVKGESHILNVPQKLAIPTTPKPPSPAMPAAPALRGDAQASNCAGSAETTGDEGNCRPRRKDNQRFQSAGQTLRHARRTANAWRTEDARCTRRRSASYAGGARHARCPTNAGRARGSRASRHAANADQRNLDLTGIKVADQSSVTDPKTGATSVTEMKNIKLGAKLDPALFKVPPDFKIAPPPLQMPPAPPYKN